MEGIAKVLHTVETILRARLLQKVNSGTRTRGRRPIVYLPIRENLVIGGRTPARPPVHPHHRHTDDFHIF